MATVFMGSRSGLLTVFLPTISVFLLYDNSRIKIKHVFYGILGIIAAILVFPLATAIRVYSNYTKMSGESGILDAFYNTYSYSNFVGEYASIFDHIIRRLCLIDEFYYIYYYKYDVEFFNQHLTILNVLKSTVNYIVPGKVFNVYSSNNLLSNLYYGTSYNEILYNWSSYSTDILSFNILHFNKVLGFLIVIMFVFLIVKTIYKLIYSYNDYFKLLGAYFLIHFHGTLIFFGYDYFFKDVLHVMATMSVVYLVNKFSINHFFILTSRKTLAAKR